MSAVLGRIKNAFRKGPRSTQLPPGAYPNDTGSGDGIGTIRKPPYPTDDDDDEDYHGVQNYNVPEQTRLRQQRETVRSDDSSQNPNPYGKTSNLPSPPLDPPNSSFRGASDGFIPGLPMIHNTTNNNQNLSSNMNTGPNSNSTATNNRSSPFAGFPPGINSNQGPPNNSPPSGGGFPPGMNPNQGPSNNSQPSGGGFPPGMNPNQGPSNNSQPSGGGGSPFNMNPNQGPSNNSQPAGGGGFPFNMNPNQTQSQSNLGMNANQPSPSSGLTNPQSSDVGRPPAINLSQTQPSANAGMNPNQTAPPSSIFSMLPGIGPVAPNTTSNLPPNNSNNMINTSSVRNQTNHNNNNDDDDNVSRLEVDYPIENVLIDANIPSTVAIKINDAIERDRFGHVHHVHRYTFEPPTPQHISFGNNHHINHHSNGNTHHGGTRHIREIPDNHHHHHQNFLFDNFNHSQRPNKHNRRRHHPNSDAPLNDYVEQLLYPPGSVVIHAQNSNDIQHLLSQHISNNHAIPQQSSTNSFLPNNNTLTEPIFYYTARALPNDPMRMY